MLRIDKNHQNMVKIYYLIGWAVPRKNYSASHLGELQNFAGANSRSPLQCIAFIRELLYTVCISSFEFRNAYR